MNEEEKNAVESLKIKAEFIGDNYSFGTQGIRILRNDLKILLNLLEKQQKELNKIKEKIEENIKEADDVLVNHNYLGNFNGNNKEQEHYYKGFKDASLFIGDLLLEV